MHSDLRLRPAKVTGVLEGLKNDGLTFGTDHKFNTKQNA